MYANTVTAARGAAIMASKILKILILLNNCAILNIIRYVELMAFRRYL